MKTKEDILSHLKDLAESDPEVCTITLATDGERNYSINQIIEEIEKETDAGKKMIKNYCGEQDGNP